jgi:hypothetical protein
MSVKINKHSAIVFQRQNLNEAERCRATPVSARRRARVILSSNG